MVTQPRLRNEKLGIKDIFTTPHHDIACSPTTGSPRIASLHIHLLHTSPHSSLLPFVSCIHRVTGIALSPSRSVSLVFLFILYSCRRLSSLCYS